MTMQNLFTDAASVLIKNTGSEEIPARSFVQVTGRARLANGREVLLGRKPADGSPSVYVVSGQLPIASGKVKGGFNPSSPVWVNYSGSVTDLSIVGPKGGQWAASSNGDGFVALGTADGMALIIGSSVQGANTLGEGSGCGCQAFIKGYPLPGDPTICCWGHSKLYSEAVDRFFYWDGANEVWTTFNEDSDLDNPLIVECCPSTTTTAGTTTTTTAGTTTTCEWVQDLYDLVVTPSLTASTIELVPRATEQCCTRSATYDGGKFRCQGSNQFELFDFCNVSELNLPSCICLAPYTEAELLQEGFSNCLGIATEWFDVLPTKYLMEFSGAGTVNGSNCDGVNRWLGILCDFINDHLNVVLTFRNPENPVAYPCSWSQNFTSASVSPCTVTSYDSYINNLYITALGVSGRYIYFQLRGNNTGFNDEIVTYRLQIADASDTLLVDLTGPLTLSLYNDPASGSGPCTTWPATVTVTPIDSGYYDLPPDDSGYCGEDCPECDDETPPTTTEGTTTTSSTTTTEACSDDPAGGYCCIAGVCSGTSCQACAQAGGTWYVDDNTCGGVCGGYYTTTTTTAGTTTTYGGF